MYVCVWVRGGGGRAYLLIIPVGAVLGSTCTQYSDPITSDTCS